MVLNCSDILSFVSIVLASGVRIQKFDSEFWRTLKFSIFSSFAYARGLHAVDLWYFCFLTFSLFFSPSFALISFLFMTTKVLCRYLIFCVEHAYVYFAIFSDFFNSRFLSLRKITILVLFFGDSRIVEYFFVFFFQNSPHCHNFPSNFCTFLNVIFVIYKYSCFCISVLRMCNTFSSSCVLLCVIIFMCNFLLLFISVSCVLFKCLLFLSFFLCKIGLVSA